MHVKRESFPGSILLARSIQMRFGELYWGNKGHLYKVCEVYGAMGVIGGHLYEVWEVYGEWGP